MLNSYDKQEQFIRYLKENQDQFYRLVYSYTRNEDDALDVIQEAIVKALKKLFTLNQTQYMKTWFYRILINESLNFIKKKKNLSFAKLDPEMLTYDGKDNIKSLEIYEAVFTLKSKYREIIVLYFFEDMTFMEIARVLKTPPSTIKSRFYKALEALKKELGDESINEKCQKNI